MPDVARMDLKEFHDFGYLAEVNRRVLHPLGLALAVDYDEDGNAIGWGVYDNRGDPEGWVFSDSVMPELVEKVVRVSAEWARRRLTREAELGFMIQPVDF